MNWKDIPQFPRASYEVDVQWGFLESQLQHMARFGKLRLEPDFQRNHVWTMAQRRAWLEYILRGGEVGRTIVFASKGWGALSEAGDRTLDLVDGLQRITTVRMFLRDEIGIFPTEEVPEGYTFSEFKGFLRELLYGFKFRVVEVPKDSDIPDLYVMMNAGGTPHTQAEIEKAVKIRDTLRKQEESGA